jgi:hypothetical protein
MDMSEAVARLHAIDAQLEPLEDCDAPVRSEEYKRLKSELVEAELALYAVQRSKQRLYKLDVSQAELNTLNERLRAAGASSYVL